MGHGLIWRGASIRTSVLLPAVAVVAALAVGPLGVPAGAASGGTGAPAWIPTQAALPSGAATATKASTDIVDTTCPSPGYCVAVGYANTSGGTDFYLPVAEIYSAGAWKLVTAVQLPTNAQTGPDEYAYWIGVSCAAPASCTMVGGYEDTTTNTFALIGTLSGTTLTASQAPEPKGAGTGSDQSAYLNAVTCSSSTACVAVGTYEDATGNTWGLIDTSSGGTWSATAAPEPTGAGTGKDQQAYLNMVACTSSAACVAVGTYQDATGTTHGLIDTLSGGTWTATSAPEPTGAGTGTTQYAHLSAVSCPASGTCVAVGNYKDGTGETHGLVDTLAGGTWTGAQVAEPSGSGTGKFQYGHLNAISCPASGTCVAVGSYTDATDKKQGLIDTLSAGKWSVNQAPEPKGAGTGAAAYTTLTSVSCVSSTQCTAVGGYKDATGNTWGLIDTSSGGTWSGAQAPQPSGAGTGKDQNAGLYAVSCEGGGCAAVGYYETTTGGTEGLLEASNLTVSGYFEAASDGGLFAFTVPFLGSMGGKPLNAPIVGAVADPLTGGYYEVASDGGLFAFTAPFLGSMGGKPLNQPIVGMAFDTTTGGYYEVASDGGLFAFTAPFLGSMGGKPLNQPVVGMGFDPATGGYWEVASDGGLFAFTAPFEGSMGGKPLDKPIVGMTYDSLTNGYYEVASDGGLFAFTAPFHGSMGGKVLNQPVVGMGYDCGTGGYWEVASDGGLFAFTAPFLGSMGGKSLNKPIVTMAIG